MSRTEKSEPTQSLPSLAGWVREAGPALQGSHLQTLCPTCWTLASHSLLPCTKGTSSKPSSAQHLSPGSYLLVPYFLVFQSSFFYFSVFPISKDLHVSCSLCKGSHPCGCFFPLFTKHSTQDIVSVPRSARSTLHRGLPGLSQRSVDPGGD